MAQAYTPKTETFTELYDSDTGYNLQHYRIEPGVVGDPDAGHVTGEGCACGPVRVTQSLTPKPID